MVDDEQGEQQNVQQASQDEQDAMVSNLEEPERGEQETTDYGPLIEAMYQRNNAITITEIVDKLGCVRSTAHKWLKRVKPVNA